jgi:hypothetical protein
MCTERRSGYDINRFTNKDTNERKHEQNNKNKGPKRLYKWRRQLQPRVIHQDTTIDRT